MWRFGKRPKLKSTSRFASARGGHRELPPWHRRLVAAEPLEPRQFLSAIAWSGAGDGSSWTDPHNWSPQQVPSSADDVTINVAGNPTVVISDGENVHTLVLGDTLKLNGATASLTIAAPSQVSAAGTLQLAGGTVNLQGNTLTSTGNVTVSGQYQYLASFSNSSNNLGGTFDNKGSLTVAAAAVLNLSDGLTLENEGTITFSGDNNSIAYGAR